jgi:hypothetical protein
LSATAGETYAPGTGEKSVYTVAPKREIYDVAKRLVAAAVATEDSIRESGKERKKT